jgi:SWI/SNF-related matrix-associated actin-dependent regulator of chromatin subfamily A-like protein 1
MQGKRRLMKKATKQDNLITIKFSVAPALFTKELDKIKSISGRKFDPIDKVWTVPYSIQNSRLLKSWGYTLDAELSQAIGDEDKPLPYVEIAEPQKDVDETKLSRLPYTLRDYQMQAVRFAEASGWNCMLAMAPRLGKSAVALSATLLHPEMTPVLIVCPASVKIIWQREIKKCLGKKSIILESTTPYEIPSKFEFVIINFDILHDWQDYLISYGFKYFICDESHRIGGYSVYQKKPGDEKGKQVPVKATAAFTAICKSVSHKVLLSGTPATSKVAQLQTQLAVLDKKFANRWWFLNRFCGPEEGFFGKTFDGASHIEELRQLTAPYIFRRTKTDVFKSLPKEFHEFLPMQIDSALYEKEMAKLKKEMSTKHLSEEELDERMSKFESLSYTAKRSQIIQWIRDFLEINDKLVVYTWFRATSNDLLTTFKKCARMVNGETPAKDKQDNIDAFNKDPKVKLFIGQISSVKEGISLAASDSVLFAELGSANSGSIEQASNRLWLPELDQKQFSYYYAVGDGSFEEKRIKVLQKRARMLSSVLDRNEGAQLFGQDLSQILED